MPARFALGARRPTRPGNWRGGGLVFGLPCGPDLPFALPQRKVGANSVGRAPRPNCSGLREACAAPQGLCRCVRRKTIQTLVAAQAGVCLGSMRVVSSAAEASSLLPEYENRAATRRKGRSTRYGCALACRARCAASARGLRPARRPRCHTPLGTVRTRCARPHR